MKNKPLLSIIVIAGFLVIKYLKYVYGYWVFGEETWEEMETEVARNILTYSGIILVFLITFLCFKDRLFEVLGLRHGILKGLGIGLLCGTPMIIGYGIMSGFAMDLDLSLIHRDMIGAGFYEEFLFRGFLFGILYYYAGWGFIPAVIIPSIYFGVGHLYQAESYQEAVNIFLFTGLASAGFAWFYTAWENLWVLIFLHGFMDLAWDMFSVDTNVTGDLLTNVFRFTTLGIMIFLSIRNLQKNPDYTIKGRLWLNKGN